MWNKAVNAGAANSVDVNNGLVTAAALPEMLTFTKGGNNNDKKVNIKWYQVDVGDLGPEGFKFVNAEDSPTKSPILIVGNEVSCTTSVYKYR